MISVLGPQPDYTIQPNHTWILVKFFHVYFTLHEL